MLLVLYSFCDSGGGDVDWSADARSVDHWFADHADRPRCFKELLSHRLPGGKKMKRDLSEFVGEVACSFCDL